MHSVKLHVEEVEDILKEENSNSDEPIRWGGAEIKPVGRPRVHEEMTYISIGQNSICPEYSTTLTHHGPRGESYNTCTVHV